MVLRSLVLVGLVITLGACAGGNSSSSVAARADELSSLKSRLQALRSDHTALGVGLADYEKRLDAIQMRDSAPVAMRKPDSENVLPEPQMAKAVEAAAVPAPKVDTAPTPTMTGKVEPLAPEDIAETPKAEPEMAKAEEPKAPAPVAAVPSSEMEGYGVHLTSYLGNTKGADKAWAKMQADYKMLAEKTAYVSEVAELKGKGPWFRLLAGSYASKAEAAEACAKLKELSGQWCDAISLKGSSKLN